MSLPSAQDGRTYDTCVLRGQRPAGASRLAQDFLADGGQLCTGVVKLAQWFVMQLCTVAGSMPFDPAAGTSFFAKLATGRLRTETDVFVAFSFAVGDIQALARRVETDATPADERFADAVLDAVAVAPGYAQLHITLTTAAGTSRPIILPVPTPAP